MREELWRISLEALEPLKAAGKVGYLLFQLPPWGVKYRDHVAHLQGRSGAWTGTKSQSTSATPPGCRIGAAQARFLCCEMNAPMVIVDEPQGFQQHASSGNPPRQTLPSFRHSSLACE
jgi:hypothetical protein